MRHIDRLHYMDSLRAVAMFLGLVIHAAIIFAQWRIPPFRSHPEASIFLHYIVELIHVFRMELFFLVAGFFAVLLCQKRGAMEFAKNRAQRILIPFLISVAFLMPWIAGECLQDMTQSSKSFLSHYWAYFSTPSYIWKQSIPVSGWFWHFWFLHVLSIFIIGFLIARAIWRKFAFPRRMAEFLMSVVSGNWGIVALTLGTYPIVLLSPPWEDVPTIATSLNILIYYGLFFAMGGLFFRDQNTLEKLQANLKYHYLPFLIALVVVLPLNDAVRLNAQPELLLQDWSFFTTPGDPKPNMGAAPVFTNPYNFSGFSGPIEWHILSLLRAYTTWCGILCFIAFFRKFAGTPSALGKYLADSSYFIYLIHFPVQLSLAYYLRDVFDSAIFCFTICLSGSLFICFVLYHFLCRPTFIGKTLSGKTYTLSFRDQWPDLLALLKHKGPVITLVIICGVFLFADQYESRQEKKLIYFSLLGEPESVESYLRSNREVDPNSITLQDGRNSLHFAASQQGASPPNRDVAKTISLLINAGISPDCKDSHGMTPLHYAVKFNNPNALTALLTHAADPDIQESKYGNSPLHIAATLGEISQIKALIDGGANPRVKRKDGLNAIEIFQKYHDTEWPQIDALYGFERTGN